MTLNEAENEFIKNHINYIRRMSLLSDEQLTILLKAKISEDSSIVEKFKDNKMKKDLENIKLMAKDIKTEPLKIARKVA